LALGADDAGLSAELRVDRVTPELLAAIERVGRGVTAHDNTVRFTLDDERALPEIASWVVANGFSLYRLAADRRSLEELFLEVMGVEERAG
jgi:hypothetical protein